LTMPAVASTTPTNTTAKTTKVHNSKVTKNAKAPKSASKTHAKTN